jgi:hypothetical protein
MPIDEEKNSRVVFVMPHELRAQLEELAKKDRRPLGSYIRNICEDHVVAASQKELVTGPEDQSGSLGIFPSPEL